MKRLYFVYLKDYILYICMINTNLNFRKGSNQNAIY